MANTFGKLATPETPADYGPVTHEALAVRQTRVPRSDCIFCGGSRCKACGPDTYREPTAADLASHPLVKALVNAARDLAAFRDKDLSPVVVDMIDTLDEALDPFRAVSHG